MRIILKPKSTMGKWSIGLIITFTLFFAMFLILVASGQRSGDTFFSNLSLTIPMLLAAVSGVSALVTGIIGIVKSRERSVFVFLAMVIGLFVLIFLLGEILSPH